MSANYLSDYLLSAELLFKVALTVSFVPAICNFIYLDFVFRFFCLKILIGQNYFDILFIVLVDRILLCQGKHIFRTRIRIFKVDCILTTRFAEFFYFDLISFRLCYFGVVASFALFDA